MRPIVIMLMLLPFQVTMAPNVIALRTLGLIDTMLAVVLPMWFSPFYVFLLRQFMLAIPGAPGAMCSRQTRASPPQIMPVSLSAPFMV